MATCAWATPLGMPTWRAVPAKCLQATGQSSPWRHDMLVGALPVVIAADVVRPSPGWLAGAGPAAGGLFARGLLARNMAMARDPKGIAQLAALCDATPCVPATARGQVLYRGQLGIGSQGRGPTRSHGRRRHGAVRRPSQAPG